MSDTRITYDDLLEFTRDCLVAVGVCQHEINITTCCHLLHCSLSSCRAQPPPLSPTQSGSSEKNAQIVAEVLVASDLRGIQSHGVCFHSPPFPISSSRLSPTQTFPHHQVNRLEFYCHEVKQRTINPTGEPVCPFTIIVIMSSSLSSASNPLPTARHQG